MRNAFHTAFILILLGVGPALAQNDDVSKTPNLRTCESKLTNFKIGVTDGDCKKLNSHVATLVIASGVVVGLAFVVKNRGTGKSIKRKGKGAKGCPSGVWCRRSGQSFMGFLAESINSDEGFSIHVPLPGRDDDARPMLKWIYRF